MPNVNAPCGFRLVGGVVELSYNADQWIADNYNTALFIGDPISLTSGFVTRTVAGSPVLGVFQGCEYIITATGEWVKSKFYDGVTGKSKIKCFYALAKGNTFEVQANGVLAQANIGSAYDFVVGTGNAVTGFSGTTLNSTGDGFKIQGLVQAPDNAFGAFQMVYGQFMDSDLQFG